MTNSARWGGKEREDSYKITKLERTDKKFNWYHRNKKGLWDYYEKLCDNKLDNLEEIDKFIEIYKLLRLNHE